MNRGQAVADLSIQLSAVTTIERAQEIIQRALRSTGLTHSTIIDEAGMDSLLEAIAGESGAIQELAEQIAVSGITDVSTTTTTDQNTTDQTAA